MNPTISRRRGISLLEVLISIGILSIGLLSVLALLPAGRTYLVKAEIDDRAATIIPSALSTMEALGLFATKSLDWSERPVGYASDPEKSAERPMFMPQAVLLDLGKGRTTESKIDEQRWDTSNVETARILTRHPGDTDSSVRLQGTAPPRARVRISRSGLSQITQAGALGNWTFYDNLSSVRTTAMEIHETGPSVGQVRPPSHWTDVSYTCEVEQQTATAIGLPVSAVITWVATPFTIFPDPSRSDPTNIAPPGYRHFGPRRKTDERIGKASITLTVAPMDRSNNTPDTAQVINPPKLLDNVYLGKIQMIRRAWLEYAGAVWRFQTGTWKAPYKAEFSFSNTEAQAVTNRAYRYPSFWRTPASDPPGDRGLTSPPIKGKDYSEDVDYVTFPVSAGDAFQLDWSKSPSTTNLADLADPIAGTGDPFQVEFRPANGSWTRLDPFDGPGHQYSVPNDGSVRLGVGLKAYTGLPGGGPANTITYENSPKDSPNPTAVVPKNTAYNLSISLFRPDRMVAIDPLMCAHLDRVIGKSRYSANPLQHPLAPRRLRFAEFSQWFQGDPNNARAFVIPRLNWKVIADDPGFDAAVAVAERICRVEDSIAANTPASSDAASEPGFDVVYDRNAKRFIPVRRQAAGRMTWMLTVQPEDPGSVESNWHEGRAFTASVVVFQDRRFPEVGSTTLDGEYAFEAGWSDDDGLLRIYVDNTAGGSRGGGQQSLEDEDLKRLFGAGSWLLLGPRVTYTSQPIDDLMGLEWIKIQSSQIEQQGNRIVVSVLLEKEPGENVLLRSIDDDSRKILDDGPKRLRVMVLAYQGVVAVIQRSIQVRP